MYYYQKYIKYKIKYLSLNKSQKGGNTENIIFACTTLLQNSTLALNFDAINREFNTENIKNTYLIYEKPINNKKNNLDYDLEFKKKLNDLNYTIMQNGENSVYYMSFISFLSTHPDIKFDKIIFAQCNDMISTLTFDSFTQWQDNRTSSNYVLLLNNIKLLYNSISDGGCIINYYYDFRLSKPFSLMNIENTRNEVTTYQFFIFHFIICRCINELFTNTSTGKYIKNASFENTTIEDLFEHNKTSIVNEIIKLSNGIKYTKQPAIPESENEKEFINNIIIHFFGHIKVEPRIPMFIKKCLISLIPQLFEDFNKI